MFKGKVLVVDDDPRFNQYVCDVLRLEGFDVESVENGNDALSQLLAINPDLILLDINMPGIDGFEVCKKITETYHKPIIFLSAMNRPDIMQKLKMSNAITFMPKPIRIRELISKVYSVLQSGSMG